MHRYQTAEAVICGAGIAGVAVASELIARGMREVLLVEQGDPLALTSDKSTECYRNWWPGPGAAMVALMNRSIDRLEQIDAATGGRIRLNRRGYLYASADPARSADFVRAGLESAALGAGPLRVHGPLPAELELAAPALGDPPRAADRLSGAPYLPAAAHSWRDQPDGADLITDPALIRMHFPYLSEQVVAVLHARRCGWFSAQQLGMELLERARAGGARVVRGQLSAVETVGGRVAGVRVATSAGELAVATPLFIDAAGPMVGAVARLLGVELPIFNELHLKAALADQRVAIPRDAPMLIWADQAELGWDAAERAALAEDADLGWMAGRLPAGAHCRPEGGGASTQLLLLWDYHGGAVEPRFPLPLDPEFPEIVLRGLATMLPGLRGYLDRMPRAYLDGGYYTKTRENRPLIGPLPLAGAYVIGALSGFGLMAACAAGELLADLITGAAPPSYAPAFALERYADPAYAALIESWGASGQL